MSKQQVATLDLTARLVIMLWAVTFAHHAYGGVRFDSPERAVMAVVFTGIVAVTLLLRHAGVSRRWAHRAYLSLVVGFWVILLGLYEGGYNHTLFVVLRLVAPGQEDRIYSAGSDALISNDAFFQGTGVLTLIAALAVAAALPQAFRVARANPPAQSRAGLGATR